MPWLRTSSFRRLALALAPLAALALVSAGQPAQAASLSPVERAQLKAAHAESCRWARVRAEAPKAQPFLDRLVEACRVVEEGGYLAAERTLRSTGPMARIAAEFTISIQRATRGLNRLYAELWRARLKQPNPGIGVVEVTDTSMFLAFQHERTFRHADALLRAHDLAYSTATLRGTPGN